MQKGEFDNLSGKGKPLESSNHNPLLDVTTQNINRILVDNGYAPEWVMLQGEIRYSISMLCFPHAVNYLDVLDISCHQQFFAFVSNTLSRTARQVIYKPKQIINPYVCTFQHNFRCTIQLHRANSSGLCMHNVSTCQTSR